MTRTVESVSFGCEICVGRRQNPIRQSGPTFLNRWTASGCEADIELDSNGI